LPYAFHDSLANRTGLGLTWPAGDLGHQHVGATKVKTGNRERPMLRFLEYPNFEWQMN
jgi:hypothetical protein